MSNHQPSAGVTTEQVSVQQQQQQQQQHQNHHLLVEAPTICLMPGAATVPISLPCFRLRNVSFLRQAPHELHPSPATIGGGAPTNNNNYELYKPSTNGHDAADTPKIKLETSDGEGSGEPDGRTASRSETGSSCGGTLDSQQQSPVGTVEVGGEVGAVGAAHHLLRSDEDDGDEDPGVLMDDGGDESNDTVGGTCGGGGGGGGAHEHDDSEPDDNKLAPQDQEKMTQAVKKVFTDYKWTPPVAPIR
uniref:Uncharacterized protein n=1 Tax=Anopheles dirus TaxID=7168 RepID=A0A182MZS5_9DIPT